MRKFKAEYITSGIFLCIIIVLMFSAVCVYTTRKINSIINSYEEDPDMFGIKFGETLYPFENTAADVPQKAEIKETIFEKVYLYVKQKCEDYSSKNLINYDSIVDTAKMYEETVQWNMTAVEEYNGVVKLHDGYLTIYISSRDVKESAKSTTELAEFCRERGIDFFYANLPTKICVSEGRNISGVLDFSNQNADRFLAMLNASGVRNYDFRKLLHDDGMNHHEAFYVTDHHWKAETGLWAARHILRILRDDYGYDVNPDVLNSDRFDYVIYPEWFLGSHGKKIKLERTKPEDFTMIYPKFKTRMHYVIPAEKIDISGDFTVTYDMKNVESKDYYHAAPYHAYNYGGKRLFIKNENLMNDNEKILIIHDSFSNSVIPFVALGVKITYSIDLRNFTGSVRTFIKKEKPDAVIVIYFSQIPSSDTFYNLR